MRIVSWNCCDAFNRKFGHLERLNPDIAIVSECRPECLHSAGLWDRSFWIGETGKKGLAVIAYNGWRITGVGPQVSAKWFAPLVLSSGERTLQVVGVWLNDGADYVRPTLSALEVLSPFILAAPTLLAGDFNQSVTLDKGRGLGRRFADTLMRLADHKLASAWHTFKGEDHGQESQPTLHHMWQEDKVFHIDYVFYPPEVLCVHGVALGTHRDYVASKISDHVPLIVDFA